MYHKLAVEHAIDPSQRLYCPYKNCSAFMEGLTESERLENGRTTCPTCTRAFCVNCKIPGWHEVGVQSDACMHTWFWDCILNPSEGFPECLLNPSEGYPL